MLTISDDKSHSTYGERPCMISCAKVKILSLFLIIKAVMIKCVVIFFFHTPI